MSERQHDKYDALIAHCKGLPATACAVAHPCDESSLRGAVEAAELGLIRPILVGRARASRRSPPNSGSTSLPTKSSIRRTAWRLPKPPFAWLAKARRKC
jgi:hypothetical protein